MSVDDLLSDLALQCWLVNNCYQPDPGIWRVSLRRPTNDGDWFTDWAEGPSMEDALAECMSKLLDAKFTPTPTTNAFIEAPANLFDALGLAKPKPQVLIKRRF